ncbi:ABC transporter permease [Demequina litorisediminis]|uniref:ABC transporter permease n=1 Tax=Demequina litorisediminis TaxID=1849022 RepID=UPI0024E16BF0|nr:ABC transporter permease subunit [Demequina litorisediminis]
MDMATRLVSGMQRSLFAAVVVTGISAVIGTAIGVIAGFKGGWIDSALMRFTDIFLAFPAMIIAMAIAAAIGQSLGAAMVGIIVVWWPLYARLVRGEVRRVVALPHVQAARVSGVKGWKLADQARGPRRDPHRRRDGKPRHRRGRHDPRGAVVHWPRHSGARAGTGPYGIGRHAVLPQRLVGGRAPQPRHRPLGLRLQLRRRRAPRRAPADGSVTMLSLRRQAPRLARGGAVLPHAVGLHPGKGRGLGPRAHVRGCQRQR